MADKSIKENGYKENGEKEINMIPRLFKRWETEGIVMPEEQRIIYESLAPTMMGQVVLDAGCGTGIGTNILAGTARFVWGVDVNQGSIKFANQMFGNDKIKFDVMDLTNPPPRERAKFHQVLCVDVLEHIEDYQKAIDTLKTFIRPGVTKVWISTPNRNNDNIQKDTPRNEFHVREWTVGEFYDILVKNFKYVTLYNNDMSKTVDLDSKDFLIIAKCEEIL